ncbi:hypothetical protein BDZ97DRAFT_352612 [Flammula alnicola]|nr:hypothetical protein BDZ97DRAFT_352612 [Flammula alnicola]
MADSSSIKLMADSSTGTYVHNYSSLFDGHNLIKLVGVGTRRCVTCVLQEAQWIITITPPAYLFAPFRDLWCKPLTDHGKRLGALAESPSWMHNHLLGNKSTFQQPSTALGSKALPSGRWRSYAFLKRQIHLSLLMVSTAFVTAIIPCCAR